MPVDNWQGNGLLLKSVTEAETGIYSCYLDNFVQPIVSYKFSLMVEGTVCALHSQLTFSINGTVFRL